MADQEEDFTFETDFPSNISSPAANDPWISTSSESHTIPKLPAAPMDPLRNIISSEMYIESLEKKLTRIQGKQQVKAKASDMIHSLQDMKAVQMTQMLAGSPLPAFNDEDNVDLHSVTSNIQRKLNPEKQALNPQELLPLVNNDILAKLSEQGHGDAGDTLAKVSVQGDGDKSNKDIT